MGMVKQLTETKLNLNFIYTLGLLNCIVDFSIFYGTLVHYIEYEVDNGGKYFDILAHF